MFDLTDKVVVITGGAGFLGQQHAEAVAQFRAVPVLVDLREDQAKKEAARIRERYSVNAIGRGLDVTSESQVSDCCKSLLDECGRIDALINNASNDPKVGQEPNGDSFTRLENFSLEQWNKDLNVGLTGAFLCSKYFGSAIANNPEGGVIINISSDLGLISPDQRLYRREGIPESQQRVKPVSYSVVKSGVIGLTRYLATYWADKNVRCNAVCFGGVENNQDEEFRTKLERLIPLARMAKPDEYMSTIVYMIADASSYLNGAILSIDGGRTVW